MGKISINIKSGSLEKEEDTIVGIDLGTTNSLIAIYDHPSGKAKILGDGGHLLVPSIVHITPDGKPLVGETAKNALISYPETTIFSVKRLLGRSYKDIEAHADFLTHR